MQNNYQFRIPLEVRNSAAEGNRLRELGFLGGTQAGWNRGRQLANGTHVSAQDIRKMRSWFARHGPAAKNGGTSYPGYRKWVDAGKPSDPEKKKTSRGAVSWLLWGGDAALVWVNSRSVQKALSLPIPHDSYRTKK